MSKEITDGKPIPLSHIKHKKCSDIDIKISRNIHRFRSTKTAEKYFDMIIQDALKDAFIAGQEVGYERPHAWAYIQGVYNSRIKKYPCRTDPFEDQGYVKKREMKELEDTIRSVIRQAVISGKHATTADESVRIQDQMCDYAVERILNASKKAFQTQ